MVGVAPHFCEAHRLRFESYVFGLNLAALAAVRLNLYVHFFYQGTVKVHVGVTISSPPIFLDVCALCVVRGLGALFMRAHTAYLV